MSVQVKEERYAQKKKKIAEAMFSSGPALQDPSPKQKTLPQESGSDPPPSQSEKRVPEFSEKAPLESDGNFGETEQHEEENEPRVPALLGKERSIGCMGDEAPPVDEGLSATKEALRVHMEMMGNIKGWFYLFGTISVALAAMVIGDWLA